MAGVRQGGISATIPALIVLAALLACGGSRRDNGSGEAQRERQQLEEQQRREAQEVLSKQEADLAKKRQHEQALAEYSAMTPAQRSKPFVGCVKDGCDGDEELMLQAAPTERERASLRRLGEQLRRAPQKARSAPKAPAERSRGSNRVQCCDGSLSPSCTYDRPSLRGCCSHHGGVC